MNIPDKETGVVAFGIKTGIITGDDNLLGVIKRTIAKHPDMIRDGDILCVTESVVAITQHNIVTLDQVAREIRSRLNLGEQATLGVIHPILSRNRFSMLLKAMARAVRGGKVIIQLRFPADEQGNPVIARETLKKIHKGCDDIITTEEIGNDRLLHPETGMDYIDYYEKIVTEAGSKTEIYLSNSVEHLTDRNPDAIIVSNVHERNELLEATREKGYRNVITLQDIYSDPAKEAYSAYGLLGSNILDPVREQLKLMPKNPDAVCEEIRKMVSSEFKKDIEVLIYGDGAYKDPESGIFELADPVSCFGCTRGIKNRNRIGVKTKYLMQTMYNEGRSKEEIARFIELEREKFLEKQEKQEFNAQGTTPRKIENLVSSLADLVSGSGDANTPLVAVRGFI
ncbi:MAG: coenzyme F420-0:L-glutamate ligase [Bacteroidales bacterium]|nr:coenzyme F420-0:L-glutamate ligase [Bacteroidales bacterium]